MIYILTGDIRSGKTTALLEWAENRNDADGLVCPDNENKKRYFLKVKSKEAFKLEVDLDAEASEGFVEIGNFKFLKSAFDQANDFLISITSETEYKFLVIDELGKLELKNEGLHHAAKMLIPDFVTNTTRHLILVVRDYLLDDIVKQYAIRAYLVLKKENLKTM